MNQDPVRVHQIHWTRVFPFLRLFQAGGLGCGLSTLILAYLCLLTCWTGSTLLTWGLTESVSDEVIGFSPTSWGLRLNWTGPLEFWESQPALPPPVHGLTETGADTFLERASLAWLFRTRSALFGTDWYVAPVLLVWNVLVLGLFGTAMARTVATEFCQHSRSGVIASLRYAGSHWKSTLLSTGLALAFPAVLKAMVAVASLVTRLDDAWQPVAGALWGLVLLASVVLALLCIVGGLAWLLSLAATGTDGCTGAESLSRCISYLLSHPVWTAAALVLVAVVSLSVRWVVEVILAAGAVAMPAEYLSMEPNQLIHGWLFFIRMIPHAFHLSAFIAGITVCYVLLRQREDGITTEEIDGAL